MTWSVEQWFTFIGIAVGLVLGVMNWYDRRHPRPGMSMLENAQIIETQNKAIELANRRALEAETERDHLEEETEEKYNEIKILYEQLKVDLENWTASQNYRIVFDVILGGTPEVVAASIFHHKDRRIINKPYDGVDRRINK